jgi:ABC-type uncharacterized transport system substrate-binding protein
MRSEEAKKAMQEVMNKQLNGVAARRMVAQEEVTIVTVITVPDHNSMLEAMEKFRSVLADFDYQITLVN